MGLSLVNLSVVIHVYLVSGASLETLKRYGISGAASLVRLCKEREKSI